MILPVFPTHSISRVDMLASSTSGAHIASLHMFSPSASTARRPPPMEMKPDPFYFGSKPCRFDVNIHYPADYSKSYLRTHSFDDRAPAVCPYDLNPLGA